MRACVCQSTMLPNQPVAAWVSGHMFSEDLTCLLYLFIILVYTCFSFTSNDDLSSNHPVGVQEYYSETSICFIWDW